MKKDELLKIKSVIIAMAMTMSLSACQKDAKNQKYQVNYTAVSNSKSAVSTNDNDSKSYDVFSASSGYSFIATCSAVVIENEKAIIYDLSSYTVEQDNTILKLPTGMEDKITVPSNNVYIFETASHHKDAVAFANYYYENVITYDELVSKTYDEAEEQKLSLNK